MRTNWFANSYRTYSRALIEINIEGKSAHASNPDNGINPLYISKNIIDSVEKLSDKLNYKVAKKVQLHLKIFIAILRQIIQFQKM